MRAEVKSIFSSDFDERAWWPENEDNFSFWVQILAGPEDGEGGDLFEIQVCTPKWIIENIEESSVIIGSGRIIMIKYDWQRLEAIVREWVRSWEAESWHELALRIARIGRWEFDGIIESNKRNLIGIEKKPV